jgi:hypothetical protein
MGPGGIGRRALECSGPLWAFTALFGDSGFRRGIAGILEMLAMDAARKEQVTMQSFLRSLFENG